MKISYRFFGDFRHARRLSLTSSFSIFFDIFFGEKAGEKLSSIW